MPSPAARALFLNSRVTKQLKNLASGRLLLLKSNVYVLELCLGT